MIDKRVWVRFVAGILAVLALAVLMLISSKRNRSQSSPVSPQDSDAVLGGRGESPAVASGSVRSEIRPESGVSTAPVVDVDAEFRGRIVLEAEGWDGTFSGWLHVDLDGSPRASPIPVVDGEFAFRSAENHLVRATSAELERFNAKVIGEEALLPREVNLVHVAWEDGVLVHVRGLESDVDLTEVEVRIPLERSVELLPSGPYPSLVEQASPQVLRTRSPFFVPWARETRRVWVTAPGYAWGGLSIEGRDGQREVRLPPGGALSVTLAPAPSRGARAEFALSGPSAIHSISLAVDQVASTTELRGVPADVQVCSATVHSAESNIAEVGSAPVRIIVGSRSEVVVPLAPDPNSALASLTVEYVEAAGGSEPESEGSVPQVVILRIGDSMPSSARNVSTRMGLGRVGPGVWRGVANRLSAGSYEVATTNGRARVIVELSVGGSANAVLRSDTTQRRYGIVIDSRTGEQASGATVVYSVAAYTRGNVFAAERSGDGQFAFFVGDRPLEFMVSAPGYMLQRVSRTPAELDELTVFELVPSAEHAVVVSAVSNGASFPMSTSDWSGVELISLECGQPVSRRRYRGVTLRLEATQCEFIADSPGRYLLKGPASSTFEFDEVEVEVPEQGDVLLAVEMRALLR